MASDKITDLSVLSSAANDDLLPIVDVSDLTGGASGTTKKIRRDVLTSGLDIQPAITGYLPTSQTFTNNTTCSMTITAGSANDSTLAKVLAGGPFTWNVSNGNQINGYQGGTTLPNSSTIHFYVCYGASGYGSFASTSLTPTLPSGYDTYYRRIFSLNTNSSGVLRAGLTVEAEGGSIIYYLASQVLDVSVTNLGVTTTLYTLTVPTGLIIQPLYRLNTPTNNRSIIIFSQQEPNLTVSGFSATGFTASPGATVMNNTGTTNFSQMVGDGILTTDTAGRIAAGADGASTALYFVTRGYKDFRRS